MQVLITFMLIAVNSVKAKARVKLNRAKVN